MSTSGFFNDFDLHQLLSLGNSLISQDVSCTAGEIEFIKMICKTHASPGACASEMTDAMRDKWELTMGNYLYFIILRELL